MEQRVFPSIRVLITVEHSKDPFDEERVAAIVELARSQHMRGMPFERVVFHMKSSAGMAEWLEPWVRAVDFSEETISADYQDSI